MRRAEMPGAEGEGLSERRRVILRAITDLTERNGYPPSMREIGAAAGLASTSAVTHQMRVLQKQGYLSRQAGQPRTAVVLESADPSADEQADGATGDGGGEGVARVPLAGWIAAGIPTLADERDVEAIPLPKRLIGEGDFIILTVAGDSMIGAAIADGDWVVVRRESDIENGDIVAAQIKSETTGEPEATVKTFKKRDGHVWLMPHNPAYLPIAGDKATILGKVVAVLRRV